MAGKMEDVRDYLAVHLMSLLTLQLLLSWNWTVWLGLQSHKD